MSDGFPSPRRMPHPSQVDGSPLFILDMTPSVKQVAGVLGAVTTAVMVAMAWAAVLSLWVIGAVAATLP